MAKFLLELYLSRADMTMIDAAAKRARQGAEELTAQGTPVRYLNSLYLPDEETCFYLYEAAAIDHVRAAAARAGLPNQQIVKAITNVTVD